jgi:hypothetical protein
MKKAQIGVRTRPVSQFEGKVVLDSELETYMSCK